MINNSAAEKLVSQKTLLPNVNTLLKISLGLVLFTIISFILVYAETIPVDVDGTIYDVEYAATGMTVSAIEADLDFFSLILTVTVVGSPGVLDITLDRSFFDSTFNGLDDDFIILADGDEPIFTEIASNSQSRMLRIELPSGTEEVEIIGSSFSPVSVMIGDFDEDKAAADKAAADKAAADKAAADKAAADKAVPKVQCGPGTILKDGACVLDQRCGPGTILKDGACVLDSTSKPTQTSVKGMGKELVMGVVAAFVIAGTVGLILGIMSKASKSS